MKTRRILQNIFAFLCTFIAIALALIAIIAVIGTLENNPEQLPKFNQIILNFVNGLTVITDKITFAPNVITLGVLFGLPALLTFVSACILFGKNTGKQGLYFTSQIVAIISVAFVTVIAFVFGQDMLIGQDYDYYQLTKLICVGTLALLTLITILTFICKGKKVLTEAQQPTEQQSEQIDQQPTEQPTEQIEEEQPTEQVEEQTQIQIAVAVAQEELPQQETVQEVLQEEKQQEEQQNTQQQAGLYVPDNTMSVHEVVEKTYTNQTEQLDSITIAKIKKVRLLYEQNVITKDEYIGLINKYLCD